MFPWTKLEDSLLNNEIKKHLQETQSRNNPHPIIKSHSTEAQSRAEHCNPLLPQK